MKTSDVMSSEKEIQSATDAAIAFLEGRTNSFPAYRTIRRLEALKSDPKTTEWLEASILARVAGRRQARRTVGLLSILSATYTRTGEHRKFLEFNDRINKFLFPARVTPHGYTESYFSMSGDESALEHIGHLIKQFRTIGYDVILNSGTLLGVIRDGKLIEHDDDIDLAILLKSKTRSDAAREWVELYSALMTKGLAANNGNHTPGLYKLQSVGETSVDLFPCWMENGRVYLYPHTFGELEKSSLLPTQTCSNCGHPIPAKPEDFLAINYGLDWVVPNPYFVFPWPQQKKRFRAFLKDIVRHSGAVETSSTKKSASV